MKALAGASAIVLGGVLVGACTPESDWQVTRLADATIELGLPDTTWTSDVWEVTRCRIPVGTSDPVFADTDRRLSASADDLIAAIEAVGGYFSRWSGGRYRAEFVPGFDVVLDVDDPVQACIDRALDASASDATGMIVVADAPHRDDRAGGWTQPGRACREQEIPCSARSSRRAVYLGANDFWALDDGPEATASVPLDLVEHEMGHSFGWPHSSRGADGGYDSIIDVMSDSAAPRRHSASLRDGPGVLALHRLGAGWLDPARVTVLEPGAGTVELVLEEAGYESEKNSATLIIIAVDEHVVVTIELVVAAADNAHLTRSGVAVHLVEWGPDVCTGPGRVCLGVDRRVTLLGDTSDGLLGVDDSIEVAGFRLDVTALGTVDLVPRGATMSAGDAEPTMARVTVRR